MIVPAAIIEQVRELAERGLTAAEIARKVRKTRNSVCGICWRNGIGLGADRSPGVRKVLRLIKARGHPKEPNPEKAQRVSAEPQRKRNGGDSGGLVTKVRHRVAQARKAPDRPPSRLPRVAAADVAPESDRQLVALLDLQPHHCRWPIGDPKQPGFGFCGATALMDKKGNYKPYCGEHHRLAHK